MLIALRFFPRDWHKVAVRPAVTVFVLTMGASARPSPLLAVTPSATSLETGGREPEVLALR